MNKRITLWRNDKIPYGTYYAYNNLVHLFKDAEIQTSAISPVQFYSVDDPPSAYIIIANTVRPSDDELRAMLNYAYAGNQVFIAGIRLGDNLLDSFAVGSETQLYGDDADSLTVSLLNPNSRDSLSFTYPGLSLGGYFNRMDSSITKVIGRDDKGKANFIKFTYENGGAVYLHLAPVTFTNFFLLHKQNKEYYDLALSSLPDTIHHIRWDDYFRHHTNGKNNSERSAFSKLQEILKNEVLRWAFWLTLLLFAIIYAFESKRKQRVVQKVPKLDNNSLDFVKTIGRLYFQRKDNKNMVSKMATHFLGHVRTRYNLPTSQLDDIFENKLAFKSGYAREGVGDIVKYINAIEKKNSVSDAELMAFHENIEKFYKHT
jgi:hypothetical protein